MGKAVSFGFPSRNRTMAEQRQGLPVYALKQELINAVSENQILVVIGETGSGEATRSVEPSSNLPRTFFEPASNLPRIEHFPGRVADPLAVDCSQARPHR